jgi:hypothetical protein
VQVNRASISIYKKFCDDNNLDNLTFMSNPAILDKYLNEFYLKPTTNDQWVSHVCADTGCSNGMVIVDGNEKVKRRQCAIDPAKIIPDVEIPREILNVTQSCPLSPINGNQFCAASKYCVLHAHHDGRIISDEARAVLLAQIDTSSYPLLLPRAQQILPNPHDPLNFTSGCKKVANVDKFYNTTAGTIVAIRPCGIIVGHCEMFRAESCSQVGVFLHSLFQEFPDRLNYVGYDRACDLHPMVTRLANRGDDWARFLSERTFFVDIFHANKHTEPKCVLGNPACVYHPKLPKFDHLQSANTEICEQTFVWWNQFRGMVGSMTHTRRHFIMDLSISYRNRNIDKMRLK